MNGIKSLDWRFLLPTPTPGPFERLVLAGATEAKAELVSAAGIATDVSRDLDGRRSADAVVCLGGKRVDLEQAAATLRPAGVLYVEVERGGAHAKPLHTLRRLRELGLRVVGVYWPHPGFELPDVYLPLDAPGAVDWYFRNSFVITTARARLLVAPVRFGATALRRRLAHVVPRVSFVAVAGGNGIAPSVLSSPALPPALRQPGVRPLVLMSGGEWSRVVVLPFAPGARQPLAAVKLWRIRGREEHLDRERRGQQLMRELLDPELRDAVPAPLGIVEWSGLVGNVEECAPGEWLFARRHRTRRLSSSLRELHVVAGWLTSFNARAQIDHGRWTDEDVERWVSGPIAQYRRAFGASPDEERLFSAAERRATELTGVPLPYVWCHNDFSELNLYCGRDSVGVVDWETVAPGLPASDLLHYVQRWFYRAQRETRDEARSFHSLFLAPSARGRAVQAGRAALASYGARLDLDERFFALLLTTEWIRRAVARHARSVPQGSSARSARRNRFARYVEILAHHVPMLFESRYRWGQA